MKFHDQIYHRTYEPDAAISLKYELELKKGPKIKYDLPKKQVVNLQVNLLVRDKTAEINQMMKFNGKPYSSTGSIKKMG